jgi:hypothetical protein
MIVLVLELAPHDGPIVGSYQGLPSALSYQR